MVLEALGGDLGGIWEKGMDSRVARGDLSTGGTQKLHFGVYFVMISGPWSQKLQKTRVLLGFYVGPHFHRLFDNFWKAELWKIEGSEPGQPFTKHSKY